MMIFPYTANAHPAVQEATSERTLATHLLANAFFAAKRDKHPNSATEWAHDFFETDMGDKSARRLDVNTATEAGVEDAIDGFGIRDLARFEIYAGAAGVVLRAEVFRVNVPRV
jgi:hypothetical protein